MTTPHAPIPDGSVIITPTEVYAEVRAIHDEVKSVSAKLDALPLGDHAAQLGDHEVRLRALERARWPLPSLAALTGLAALVLTLYSLTK
ncbi:hypothetical protein RKE29_01955 [Streptomyces sp. B1866]|uniref:hypothetical protein n=1 Tax=Streptomyces sp. B1866 TaxID=3075431 RepID=UPI0028923C72|nr:hypothetical protein [Streptomyces sp. B1866]MDT3395424.1 hypothetical protein [Streptomyces sp. B1866]